MVDHESVKRFPLEWPIGWTRTAPGRRGASAFHTKHTATQQLSVTIATSRLEHELERLGARNPDAVH